MLDERMEAHAVLQHGLVTRAQAFDAGLTRGGIEHRLSTGRWTRVGRGVYRFVGSAMSDRQRALVAVLDAGSEALLSHSSAAGLVALPGFAIEPIVVTVERGGRRRTSNVRYEESLYLPAHHRRVIDGIPCTSIARTIFDLCGDVRIHPGRSARALDTALSRRLVTMPALWRVFDDLAERGRRGTVWMRTLLTERGGRYVAPESELEVRFLRLVERFGLPRPERQIDVGSADMWIGRVDFLWRDVSLVVEVDGALCHDGLLDRRHDAERDRRLAQSGWRVLRSRWTDVVDAPSSVADSIRRELTSL